MGQSAGFDKEKLQWTIDNLSLYVHVSRLALSERVDKSQAQGSNVGAFTPWSQDVMGTLGVAQLASEAVSGGTIAVANLQAWPSLNTLRRRRDEVLGALLSRDFDP